MSLNSAEVSWFQQLGGVASTLREKVCGRPSNIAGSPYIHPDPCVRGTQSRPWDAPQDLREWRTFELADAMELGLAQELTTHFVEQVEQKAQHFVFQRSEGRNEFLLKAECGDPLLFARASSDGGKFEIFVAGGEDPPVALGPAFDVQANAARDRWTLRSLRCEKCEYRGTRASGPRELARINHCREEIGGGTAWCMDVTIPHVSVDGDDAVWCPVCGTGEADQRKIDLTMRMPKWNSRLQALTLDFFSRVSLASAKNCQLKVVGDTVGKDVSKVALLFGKESSDTFVLDVRRPLGIVQAFAVALTTKGWH